MKITKTKKEAKEIKDIHKEVAETVGLRWENKNCR